MTLSDAALNASLERRQFICLPRDNGGPLWVLLALGRLYVVRRQAVVPFAPTLAEAVSDLWRVSPRGPRTSAPKPRKSRTP